MANSELPEAFALPAPLLVNVLNYLAARPYIEVVGLIDALKQLEPAAKDDLEG